MSPEKLHKCVDAAQAIYNGLDKSDGEIRFSTTQELIHAHLSFHITLDHFRTLCEALETFAKAMGISLPVLVCADLLRQFYEDSLDTANRGMVH